MANTSFTAGTRLTDAGAGPRTAPGDDGSLPVEKDVLILGGGLCGIAAAIGLQREGITDVVIIERSDAFGGTWHHNRYPGCAVDIPSHVYSFSFAPRCDWDRNFAMQPELERYLEVVATDFGLHEKAELNTEVLAATWQDEDRRWLVKTTGVTYRARALILAAGPLHEAVEPNIPGLQTFAGTAFHSSAWPADIDLQGRRVVAIGTGASAVQFLPQIQPGVEHLTVLQRTASWVFPKPDWEVSPRQKRLLKRAPWLMRLQRWWWWGLMDLGAITVTRHVGLARLVGRLGRLHLRAVVNDPRTREALTPSYAPTCKRLGLSNDYLQTFNAPNVDLVGSPAAEVRENSVITADGREIPCDTIIYGTGFKTLQRHPVNERIRGRDGRTLDEVWDGAPTAYLGTSIAGFPNAFMMFGPNIGTISGFVMAEAQTDYIVGALREMRAKGLASIDVRPEVQADFVRAVDEVLDGSTFVAGGCTSYYLDERGRVALAWPWTMAQMRRRLARFDLSAYRSEALSEAPSRVGGVLR